MNEPLFQNEARAQEPQIYGRRNDHAGAYHYGLPSKYLSLWGRMLQAVVSQAGTFMLTGKFHDREVGIYKAEGGVNIVGVGDLVLGENQCYWDYLRNTKQEELKKLAKLITAVVVNWNPMDPYNSMVIAAATEINYPAENLPEFLAVLEKCGGGPFCGDALYYFFGGISNRPKPNIDDYHRWVLINIHEQTPKQAQQYFDDRDLGKALKKRLEEAMKESRIYVSSCSPRRQEDGSLLFWVNASHFYNWVTQEQIEQFIIDKKFPAKKD